MNNIIFLFYFIAVLAICMVNNVASALYLEEIVGGLPAPQVNFTYQVAILGKENSSSEEQLICGGGIIDDDTILSAAQCFFDKKRILRPLHFSIAVGTVDLKSSMGARIDVKLIYTYLYTGKASVNDYVVLKLMHSFKSYINLFWTKLNLPTPNQFSQEYLSIVAGYGYRRVEYIKTSSQSIRTGGEADFKLTYAYVRVADDTDCKLAYININVLTNLCGFMMAYNGTKHRGICVGDAGSPLVVNGYVVGIANMNSAECDDTHAPCVYLKVSSHIVQIKRMMEGQTSRHIRVFTNGHM